MPVCRVAQPPILFGHPGDYVCSPVEDDFIVEVTSLHPEIYKWLAGLSNRTTAEHTSDDGFFTANVTDEGGIY